MTIKEYSTSRKITYEAARQAVERCKPEILEHISKHKRVRILDDIAVKMLDDNRQGSSVSVIRKQSTEQTDIIDKLKNEIIVLQKQLLEERTMRLESAEKVARLEAIADTRKLQEEQIDRLQAELNRYERTIFGLYRKK